jgi:sterol desaturase/sphingolipid hydroxylase (fatty acid hydroxylase superfamily)
VLNWLADFFVSSSVALIRAFESIVVAGVFFVLLAMLLNGRAVFARFRRALPQTLLNLKIITFNALFIVPLIAFGSTAVYAFVEATELRLVGPEAWAAWPALVVMALGVTVGDFVGYWRHRLEHAPFLWPAHAVHHSDTEMTWLSLERFHPVNYVTTFLIDNAALLLLGLPPYALVANNLVRHYYGYFIHADLPWTYGPLGKVFVSPVMHRWHHAADKGAFDTNYATVFALWDRWFGTWRVPGPCDVPLGVTDDMAPTLSGQFSYFFTRKAHPWLFRRRKTREPAE